MAAVLVLALLGLGQLGKGGAPALPPLSVGPSTTTGPDQCTGPGVTGPSGSVSPSQGGPSPSPIFSGRDPFSLPPQFQTTGARTGGGTGHAPTGGTAPHRPAADRPRTDRRRLGPGPTGPTNPPTNGSTTVIGGHTVVLHRHVHDQRRLARDGRGRRHRLQPGRGCDVRGRQLRAAGRGRQLRHVPLRRRVLHALLHPVQVDGSEVPAIRPRGERSPARGRPRLGAAPAPSERQQPGPL